MSSRILDFISILPLETKRAIVRVLPGKDAATLRLASRSWRDVAAEGLFNHFRSTAIYTRQFNDVRYVEQGILFVRPGETIPVSQRVLKNDRGWSKT